HPGNANARRFPPQGTFNLLLRSRLEARTAEHGRSTIKTYGDFIQKHVSSVPSVATRTRSVSSRACDRTAFACCIRVDIEDVRRPGGARCLKHRDAGRSNGGERVLP